MASAIERLAGKGDKLSDIKTRDQHFKINEEFDFLDLSDGDLHQIRLLPGVFAHGKHWLDIEITKDGKTKTIPIPKTCLNIDMKTGSFDTAKKDPIFENREYFTAKGKDGETGFQMHYYMCVIDRSAQESQPKKAEKPTKEEAKLGFKVKGSKSWTPVRVLRIPKGCIEKIVKLASRNIKKTKGGKDAFELSDIKNGRDILISFDKDASSPANYWDVQIADDPMGPLTEEELGYLIYDIEGAIKKDLAQETLEQMEKWVSDYIAKSDGADDDDDDDDSDDDDDDEDDDRPSKKAGKKVKKSKKSSKSDDDDDDDLDLDLDDDDDDDDKEEKPKKVKKVKSISKDKIKPSKSKSLTSSKTSLSVDTKPKKFKVKKKS